MSEETEPLEPEIEPEDEPDAEPETEAEQTVAEAAADYGSSELWEKIDAANDRYINAIIKIVGKDAPLAGCDHCQGRGFTLGQQTQLPELMTAEDAEMCEKCNGYGQTKTGALEVPTAQPFKPCGGCGGRGWHEKRVQLAPVVVLDNPSTLSQVPLVAQPVGGQWVPGRGFIPYGAVDPIVVDPSGGQG